MSGHICPSAPKEALRHARDLPPWLVERSEGADHERKGYDRWIRPPRTALATASSREWASSLRITAWRWFLTVCTLSDVLARLALGGQHQNLPFARRQCRVRPRGPALDPGEKARKDERIRHELSGPIPPWPSIVDPDCPYRLLQLGGVVPLEEDPSEELIGVLVRKYVGEGVSPWDETGWSA
jgi:hypothetical protein